MPVGPSLEPLDQLIDKLIGRAVKQQLSVGMPSNMGDIARVFAFTDLAVSNKRRSRMEVLGYRKTTSIIDFSWAF